MPGQNDDIKKMKDLIKIMKENDLVEVEIKHGEDKLLIRRYGSQPAVSQAPQSFQPSDVTQGIQQQKHEAPEQVKQTEQNEEVLEIKAPIVGTFYAAASPEAEPYVEIGSHVNPQSVVCVIEAMKVMNEIKAETSGTITEIIVTNGQAVEYGQVLFKIKPD